MHKKIITVALIIGLFAPMMSFASTSTSTSATKGKDHKITKVVKAKTHKITKTKGVASSTVASVVTNTKKPENISTKTSTPPPVITNSTGAALANCQDGTKSYAKEHSGACSGHGGVKTWLDGTAN